ncbi:UTRA domain-containing protein [Streptomyces boncukensis]|uniref:UTRA domain-containing protein n=1 Tax=Streptomyces boncukensis TaxID=2711219 RepID=A0A6G4WZH8_9ACTN|nr:UTRA domain-containing protein [Streptomyces boncukensis]NGO70272.1 UTRA domain-containing protein [Streptomyces boncukensis]
MAAIDVTVSHAVEQLDARVISAQEAALLGVQRGSIVIVIRRTFYAEDRAVETAGIVVPTTRCEIVYETPYS